MADKVVAEEARVYVEFLIPVVPANAGFSAPSPKLWFIESLRRVQASLPCQRVPVHHVACDGRVVEIRLTKTLSVS